MITAPASFALSPYLAFGIRRWTMYLGGGTIIWTMAFIVAAGRLDLLRFKPTLRPDLECRRLWNWRAIRSHQVREELAFTALRCGWRWSAAWDSSSPVHRGRR